MKKFLLGTLVGVFLFFQITVAFAAGHYDETDIDVIVEPFLKPSNSSPPIRWDYRGYLDGNRVPYFNRHLEPLIDYEGNEHPLFNAAVGSTNLAMGQVMYMYGYPNAAQAPQGAAINKSQKFVISYEKFDHRSPVVYFTAEAAYMRGGADNNPFYNWNILESQPVAVNVPNRESLPNDPARDEVARLMHDIGIAMRSSYYRVYDPPSGEYPMTTTQLVRAPSVFRDQFFYAWIFTG